MTGGWGGLVGGGLRDGEGRRGDLQPQKPFSSVIRSARCIALGDGCQ